MANVGRHECSLLLSFPSSTIINYALRHYHRGHTFQGTVRKYPGEGGRVVRPNLLRTRCTVRHAVHPERRPSYCAIARLRCVDSDTSRYEHLITFTHVTELFHDGHLDFKLVLLAIQRQYEVYWTYMDSIMEYPFL